LSYEPSANIGHKPCNYIAQTQINQEKTMSIPTTETQPDSLHKAPRNQSQQVRKVLATAGPRQFQDFIDDLIRRNQLNLNFVLQLILSQVILAAGLIANLPLLILLSAVTAPVLNPMIGLVLSAIKPSGRYFLKSFLYLLITAAAFFGTGWLINLVSPSTISAEQITAFFALKDGWLEWVVLVTTSMISVYLFLYRAGGPSVVTSTVLAYLIFIPVTLVGLLYAQGDQAAAVNLLLLCGTRFFISILALLITTWVFGFSPKGVLGWLLLVIVVLASALAIFEMRFSQVSFSLPEAQPVSVVAAAPTDEPAEPTKIPPTKAVVPVVPTQVTVLIATDQPSPAIIATPTSQFAQVVSESGVVVRESPSTQAVIVTYINNGLQVTLLGEQVNDQGMDWEKVVAPDGKEGWVAARFLSVIKP